jgi:glycosyltransferase involved in cell wall biosynthesis
MNRAIFISCLSGGGAERVAVNIANAWIARGDKVTIITLAPVTEDFYALDPHIQRIGLKLSGRSSSSVSGIIANVRRIWCLRRELKSLKPDVFLGMETSASILAVLASWGMSCCVVVSERIHPPMMPVSAIWGRLRRWTYPHASVVLALTEESREWLIRNCPGSNVTVIPNAVQFPLLDGDSCIDPDQILPETRRIILAVGRLAPQKGFDMLVKAFGQIASSRPDWDLVILGEGEERENLLSAIASMDLSNRIFLPGKAGNVSQWYKRAELFVLSSRFEGFPCTLIEAMAHSLAVVSFDCDTGPRDIIRHEIDGVLVTSGDVPALATVLSQLVNDETLLRSYAAHAVEVKDRFSMGRILSMWDEVIEDIRKRGFC